MLELFAQLGDQIKHAVGRLDALLVQIKIDRIIKELVSRFGLAHGDEGFHRQRLPIGERLYSCRIETQTFQHLVTAVFF